MAKKKNIVEIEHTVYLFLEQLAKRRDMDTSDFINMILASFVAPLLSKTVKVNESTEIIDESELQEYLKLF